MLDVAAVVETITRVCEQSRPDLTAAFVAAQEAWWLGNGRVDENLTSLERLRPTGNCLLRRRLDYQRSSPQADGHAFVSAFAASTDDGPSIE
jgi:hypothetical protein